MNRAIWTSLVAVLSASLVHAEGTQNCHPNNNCQQDDSHRIHLAVGGGFSWLADDHVDYKIVKNDEGVSHLFVENDSQIRPDLLLGTLIQLDGRLHASLNLTITEGGSRAIDGVFLGFGWKVGPAVFVGGYSRQFGKELSPGFRRRTWGVDYDGYEIQDSGFPGDPLIDSVNSKVSFGIMVPLELWPGHKPE